MKMLSFGLSETKLFHFHGIFKKNKIKSAKRTLHIFIHMKPRSTNPGSAPGFGPIVALDNCSCADPAIFVRGGGVQVSLSKKALITFFYYSFFFSPQLILQKSNGQFQRNISFFKLPEGVQHFPGGGGVQLFPGGGVKLLIPYTNPYNL